MATPRFLSDLIGTLQNYFRVGGSAGIRVKNNSGVAETRNAGDSAYANLGTHTVVVHGSNASNGVSLTAPADLSGNVSFVLPGADGTAGQVLKTDGSGNFSFVNPSSNGSLVQSEAFTQATTSPLTIFTPTANAIITRVWVVVSSAASGGSPTISVGVSGTAERDMAAAENDLKAVAMYEVQPMTDVGGTPAAIIATITPDGQTFGGTVYVEYVNPA